MGEGYGRVVEGGVELGFLVYFGFGGIFNNYVGSEGWVWVRF